MADVAQSDLAEAIAREEASLLELEDAVAQVRRRLNLLREQQRSAAVRHAALRMEPPSMTTAEKVALFRSLFRGRADVFPKLWVNAKAGKKGYAPACANEWVRGVCEKPRVKCGECPNQAFIAVDDRVVLDHLQGRHIIGVYPMLEDETCWFLAADFDKSSWQDDVAAFAETARSLDVHVAIERSRSGNGAHAWMFFSSAVAASTARKMGCFIITRTMERRHQLSMDSYDRFFPNQDTMPRGGFGNLIALPLQHAPRQEGNTVFVDDDFEPRQDQWAFLASMRRVRSDVVEQIAMDAVRGGKVVGVRFGGPDDDPDARTPWMRQPSRRPRAAKVTEPLPPEVHAVIAQRLFVEKKGLSAAILNEMKRLAAFQNPEFYKKQRMQLSTAMTPRVIACAEELPSMSDSRAAAKLSSRSCFARMARPCGSRIIGNSATRSRTPSSAHSRRSSDKPRTPCWGTTSASLSRHPASAKQSSGRTSSRSARAARSSSSIDGRSSTSGSPSSRSSSASIRRRSAK
jgi:hypothetical protein